jgi:hypothetical protein
MAFSSVSERLPAQFESNKGVKFLRVLEDRIGRAERDGEAQIPLNQR